MTRTIWTRLALRLALALSAAPAVLSLSGCSEPAPTPVETMQVPGSPPPASGPAGVPAASGDSAAKTGDSAKSDAPTPAPAGDSAEKK